MARSNRPARQNANDDVIDVAMTTVKEDAEAPAPDAAALQRDIDAKALAHQVKLDALKAKTGPGSTASSVVSSMGEPLNGDELDTIDQIDIRTGVDGNPQQTATATRAITAIFASETKASEANYRRWLVSDKFAKAVSKAVSSKTFKADALVVLRLMEENDSLRSQLKDLFNMATEDHFEALEDAGQEDEKILYGMYDQSADAAKLVAKAITLSHAAVSRKGPSVVARARAKRAAAGLASCRVA